MVMIGIFTLGFSISLYNYAFARGYEAKEKDVEERDQFMKEVEKYV